MTYSIKQALFDPFGKGAYLLASDDTNSAVWNTSNVISNTPVWTKGADISGVYTVLRTSSVDNDILVYSPAAGFSIDVATPLAITAPPGNDTGIVIANGQQVTIVATGTWWLNGSHSVGPDGENVPATGAFPLPGANSWGLIGRIGTSGAYTFIGTGTTFTASASGNLYLLMNDDAYGDNSGSLSVTITHPGGDAGVRYSTTSGLTWGNTLTVGTTPGSAGGFDTQLAGAVSYAAMAGKVRKATTLGGAYADWINTTGANAVCIIIPWYTRNSTTAKNTTGATPDCLVALDAADSDGGTLYWVAGATGVKTDITPTAGITFNSPNCVTTSYGTHIAVFGLAGGVYHLYTSINGGGAWTDQGALTTPHFIRGRRKDDRAKAGGNAGQIYITNGNPIDYSRDWGVTEYPRTMPVTGIQGMDIAG